MLPPPGAPPLNFNISDISGNYEQISTKFSAICLLTRVMSITYSLNKLKDHVSNRKMMPIKQHIYDCVNNSVFSRFLKVSMEQ